MAKTDLSSREDVVPSSEPLFIKFHQKQDSMAETTYSLFKSKYFLSMPAKLFSSEDTGLSPGCGFVLMDWDPVGL